MSLLTTTNFPPLGWVYRERINGRYWTNPDPMQGLEQAAVMLFNARSNAKIKTTLTECRQAIEAFTCKRLDNDTRWCEGTAEQKAAREARERKKEKQEECMGCGRRKK